MTEYTHLDVISARMALHVHKLEQAKALKPGTKRDQQIAWSEHNIRMIERERDDEIKYLGIRIPTLDELMASNDPLLMEA